MCHSDGSKGGLTCISIINKHALYGTALSETDPARFELPQPMAARCLALSYCGCVEDLSPPW